ncbi:ATP-binding protein [Streptomyces sp. FIT100]|uniref:ATP-binding protein n=1 Tax=Streptomyces sp. FIT100 TaxID=2837956 RepID=UPI0028BDF6D7|nr:ATP-binding protein [Streptomyces sp. FIT100]
MAIFDHLDHVPALDPIPITLVQRFALVCQLLDERENSHEFLFWPIHRQRLTPGWRWPAAVQRDWLPVTRDSAVAKPITRKSRAFEVAFAPDPACVARARQITGAFLEPCNANGELAEKIVLAVSELVTNAIEHGTGEVGLRIRYSDSDVRIEVTDGNPTPAQMRSATDEDVSGRGLFLVAVLAREWGVSEDGGTTWCVFRVPAGRA